MPSLKLFGTLVLIAVFAALFQISCGSSPAPSNPGPVQTATPFAIPSPAPSPSPVPPPLPTWASVTELVNFCDYPHCAGGNGFTVISDGTYLIGDGSKGSGSITARELTLLSSLAAPVAAQTGFGLSCVPTALVLGALRYELTLTYSDDSSQQIIDVNGQTSCYYGDPALDNALHDETRVLEIKYDSQ